MPGQTDKYPTRQSGAGMTDRTDPVVYANVFDNFPELGEKKMFDYKMDGFVVAEGAIDAKEAEAFGAEIDKAAKANAKDAVNGAVYGLQGLTPAVEKLASDLRLMVIAYHVLDDECYVLQARNRAYQGKDSGWRSDFETWHAEDGMPRMRAMSAVVCLGKGESTPLEFVPGSHWRFIPATTDGPDAKLVAELEKEKGLKAPALKAGDILYFDCNVLYRPKSADANCATIVYNSMKNALVDPFAKTAPRAENLAARGTAKELKVETAQANAGK